MNDQLRFLLDLQKIDADLHFLRDLHTKRPLELQKDIDKLEHTRSVVSSIETEVKNLRMECDKSELEIKQKQEEIDRLQVALNTAKSNQEYQVLQDQIGRYKEDAGVVEEQVLGKFGRMDALQAEKEKAQEQVTLAAKDLKIKKKELEEFLGEIEQKIDKLVAERQQKVEEVFKDELDLYERVLERYEDSALAMVENRVCQGCHMSITTQVISELMMGKKLIQCKNCLRILYLPEAVGRTG